MIGIYRIQNKINGKVYIGQSVCIEKRWEQHRTKCFNPNCSQYNGYFYRSIRKYGLENFSFFVLEECSKEKLNEREIYWISYYDSSNPNKGYNLTLGGDNAATYCPKLDREKANQIKSFLEEPVLSQQEIANMYGISQKMVSEINLGRDWVDKDRIYPIRKNGMVNSFKQGGLEKKTLKKKEHEDVFLKKEYFCSKCGIKITKYSKTGLCKKCQTESTRLVDRPSREQLKEEIRNNSFLALSKKYEVSDNAIRKWCKVYNLPYKKRDIDGYTEEEWYNI